jgi:tetratricopeptide (TPR) repeat protein
MLRRYLLLGLAASSLLVSGCGSPARKGPSSEGASVRRPRSASGDAHAGKIAEAHAHYGAGVIHEMEDDSDAALDEYYQAALNDPGNETLILEVSHRFLQKKQPEKALELLNRAAERPDASGSIFARIGFIYSQLGKQDQAVAANRMAINKLPTALPGYQNLFLNYLQNKQPEDALKILDEAAAQPKTDFEFLISLSELYVNFGAQVPAQKEIAHLKALSVLHRAEKLKAADPALRLRLADGFNLLGDPAKAAELYLDLLKTMPEAPLIRERVHAKLTDIYLRGQDRKRAVEQLQAIIRDDPTNPQAYYFLGSIALDEKRLPEAAEYFGKTILLNPAFEQAYYDLAIAQINMEKAGDALSTLGKAREKFSQGFVLEFLTGMAFSHQKDYVEALAHYTSAEVIAQATDPKRLNEAFYFQIGATYERKGDLEQAEKYFQKCLKLSPDSVEAMNYLGYMWAEHGMKLEQANELIEKAVKAEPKNAAYLDSLGWVRFKLGRPKEALDPELKAVELSEEPDATVYDHLGDIYAALNQMDKASEAWRKSISIEPNDVVKKKLEPNAAK